MNRPTDIFENPGGRRGIRTPGTRKCARQFSKLLVSATHPSFQSSLPNRQALSLKCGCKVSHLFSSRQIYRNLFLKIFLFAVFSLLILRFLCFSRPKATIHPYHHRTTRRHRRLRQRGTAEVRIFVSSRGCKIFSLRKRIFSFLSRHRGRQTRTKERGGYRSNQDHTLSKATASEFHGRDIHQMVDDGIDGEAGRRMDL